MNDDSIQPTPPRRGLALLWVARDLSFLGNWVAILGLLAWTYRATESGRTAALVVVAWILLPILLRPVSAVLVNAGNARAVGSIAQLLRAAALLPLLTVTLNEDLQTVQIVAFLVSVPAAFARSSHVALLPAVVRSERLESAGRALLTTRLVAMVAGAAAGVYVFRVDELRSIAIVVAAAFVLSAVLTIFVRPGRSVEPATPRRSLAASFAESQRQLLRALQHPASQPVVVVYLLFLLAIGGEIVAKTAFVTWGLFMVNENVGFLLAAQGAGMLSALAVYGYGRRRYQASTLAAAGILMVALAEFGFVLTSDVPPASVFNFAIGLGMGFALLGLGSVLHAAWAEAQAKADGDLANGLAMAAGVAVLVSVPMIGVIVDAITPRFTLTLLSGMLMVLAVYAFGALPILKEREELSGQAVESPFSNLIPD